MSGYLDIPLRPLRKAEIDAALTAARWEWCQARCALRLANEEGDRIWQFQLLNRLAILRRQIFRLRGFGPFGPAMAVERDLPRAKTWDEAA